MEQNIDYSKYGLKDSDEPNYDAYGLQDADENNNASQIPQIPNIPQNELSYYKGINSKDILNFTLGASDETNNMLRNALNMLPGIKLQQMQSASGGAYDAGKIGGDIGAFAAGGEALEAASSAAKIIPYIGKIAQFIGKPIANSTITGGGLGFLQSPDNKLQNSVEGALLGGGGHAAIEGAKAIPSFLKKFSPTPVMLDALKKIPEQYLNNHSKAQEMYNPIIDKFGNVPVDARIPYRKILNRPSIKDFYEEYKENPTIKNAHLLQSKAQSVARNAPETDWDSGVKKEQLFKNSNELKNAIKKSLGDYGEDYNQADIYFKNNVIPYDMISNKLEQLISAKKNPQNVLNAIEQATKSRGYPKVKINKSPKKVPVIPEDIQQYISTLNSTIKNKKSLQKLGIGVGATGAGLEGYHLIKRLFGGEQ